METIIRSRIFNIKSMYSICVPNFTEVKINDLVAGNADVKLIGVQLNDVYSPVKCKIVGNKCLLNVTVVNDLSQGVKHFFNSLSPDIIESVKEENDKTIVVFSNDLVPHEGDIVTFKCGYHLFGIPESQQFIKTGGKEWRTFTFVKGLFQEYNYSQNIFGYDDKFPPKYINVGMKIDPQSSTGCVYVGKLKRCKDNNYILCSNDIVSSHKINVNGKNGTKPSICICLYSLYGKFITKRDLYKKIDLQLKWPWPSIVYTFEITQKV